MIEHKKGKAGKEHFTELHPTVCCQVCQKPIKARLVRLKPRVPEKCYKCYQAGRRKARKRKEKTRS